LRLKILPKPGSFTVLESKCCCPAGCVGAAIHLDKYMEEINHKPHQPTNGAASPGFLTLLPASPSRFHPDKKEDPGKIGLCGRTKGSSNLRFAIGGMEGHLARKGPVAPQ
jgi:hypothetical protein